MDSNDVNNIDGLEEENSISEGEENEEDKDELVEDDEVLEEKSDFAYEF